MDTSHDNLLSDLDFAQTQAIVVSPATADFVRRLYKLLEDPANDHVISWTPERDSFVIKDTSELSKQILPPIFSHSNFASFVRQLNKYGFNKVKKTEYNHNGDLTWTFRHPDFHADKPEALENIKRKPSNQAKSNAGTSSGSLPTSNADSSSSLPYASSSSNQQQSSSPFSSGSQSRQHGLRPSEPSRAELKLEIQMLKNEGEDLRTWLRNLERDYEAMLDSLLNVEKAVSAQDQQMENMQRHLSGRSPQRVPSRDDRAPLSSVSPVDASQSSLPKYPTSIKRKRDEPAGSKRREEEEEEGYDTSGNIRPPRWSSLFHSGSMQRHTEATSQSGRITEQRHSAWQARRDHRTSSPELYASSRTTARSKGRLWSGLNFSADAPSTISEEDEDRSLQRLPDQDADTEPNSWNQDWDSSPQELLMGTFFDPTLFEDQSGSTSGSVGGWQQDSRQGPGGERVVVMQRDGQENRGGVNQYTSAMAIATDDQVIEGEDADADPDSDADGDGDDTMPITSLGGVSHIVVDRGGMDPNFMEGTWGL